ncbi:MAG: putative Ig domain-containing protein [Synergistales bacterium]|nr:putative Ig domain-containing protein [Synergistales bacterium]MDY6415008.1 putative Ig domain-containing protein [Synergistales bacterium]MDY6432395.1 putative Ig domain-containing protein [Synergistales bacterium]MDY6434580.1 putative Ig domain-containing protein [Synergistales bacterium]
MKFLERMKFSGFFILLLFVLTLTASAQAETVATISNMGSYETLQAALNAIENYTDQTITLIKDVNEPNAECRKSNGNSYNGNIIIDLNGHSANLKSINIEANLTIKNGTLTCYIYNANVNGNKTLALDNATLSCDASYGDTPVNAIDWYAKNISVTNNSTLSINGPAFLGGGADDGFTLTLDNTSSIILKNVTLSNYNINRVVEQLSPYLPSGYSFNISGETATVTPAGTVTLSALKSLDITAENKTLNVSYGSEGSLTLAIDKVTGTYAGNTSAEITGAAVSWSAVDLPTGITLDGNVLKTASTLSAGSYTAKLKVTAAYLGREASKDVSVTVTVTAASTPSTKTLQNVTVSFSSAPTTLTVTQGATATTAAFTATATATYTDSSTASLTPTLTLESDYNWITFNASTGIVTVAPTTSVSAGNYSVKIKATATADGVTQTAETTLTVTVVNASATITPKSLTFDKSSITIDFDVDEGISVSDSVSVTVKDDNGNDITALGEIVCEKLTADFDELTSAVDGNKITFTVPAGTDPESKTVMFTVKFRYDGKDYLMTNYKVVVYRTKLGRYELTLSPVEINVIPGRTASLDLKNSVKFEKVYQNNHRQTVEDAKMIFSLNTAVSWINCDSDSGVVTLNPGADVETGVLEYRYKVKAEYDGNSETEAADFKVNVVKKSPAITTETLPNATVNTPYSQTFMATGDDPITWSITNFESHPFPDWLTIDAGTGTISGTPASEGLFSFTVQASNAYGTDSCGFSIKVTKDVLPASWKYSLDPVAGRLLKPKQTFHYKRRVAKGENINYTYKEKGIPSGKYLKSVFEWDKADGAVKEGTSYIKFNLSYRGNTHDYVFMEGAVTAKNDYGTSKSPERTITVTKNEKNDNGKISHAALEAEDGLITLADDEDGGEELSGSMYFDDGGTDEDGNITGVIGGENAKFKMLADFINSLTEEQCAKVIRIEFRKGAEVSTITAADIEKLTGLLEIAVDESETLTEFNLNGNKILESVSIFKCSALEKLDVKNCVALYHLEAAQCPKLTALDVEGCSSLEAIWLNGSSVTNLNLSGSDFANVADIDLTECNSLTSLNVDGCAALSNLYAPYTAVTELNLKNNPELTDVFLNETKVETLDLSNNAKLKSLSLVGATELADLKLAEGVELEEFEVTGSKITELDYTGNDNITTLNLSGNTELKTLNLTDCASLKELTLTGTPIEKLTLSGCYSLEKIEAEGCSALTTLPLDKDNSNVREIYLSGSGLTALDVGACEKLTSLDVSGCTELASLNARSCSLKWLDVTACAKLTELDCSENQLGWLNLDGLTALSNVNYSGQEIYGWVADTRMKMSDYIGSNDIGRIADILAYGANEIGIETTLEDGDGNVYKADTEYYAVFKSVPEKVVYYYDTKFSGGPMDVTLTGKSSPTEIGGSGGGCDSIRNEKLEIRNHLILALFVLALALLKKRRIKKM